MSFLWPQMLWFLIALPLLIAAYIYVLRRKRRIAMRYANLSVVRAAMGVGPQIRQHIPPLLFLIAIILLLVAMARPAAVVTLPSENETVILAMDVSGSMRAGDVEPSRIAAAQAAARTFVQDTPRSARVGVVAFAATASLVQAPTQNREDVLAAIDRFQLQYGTAIGSGIVVSLATLFPDAKIDVETMGGRRRGEGRRGGGMSLDSRSDASANDASQPAPVPPGSYQSAVIILLSDGQTTTGPDPMEAAKMAADRGVRVFTVGVGTPDGEVLRTEGWSMRVRLDEDALKNIANVTHGDYFYAGNAADLKNVYKSLNTRLVMERRQTEITAFFTAGAALFAVVSALLSLLWFNRIL